MKVSKAFNGVKAINDISISIGKSEVVCIIGPSGSGKSTLLRCMNFLEEYDSGEVRILGKLLGYRKAADGSLARETERNIDLVRKPLGMVFQHFNLWPHMSALRNVTEALRLVKKMDRTQAETIGMDMLQMVGLADKAHEYPGKLSGGQQQRVGIARALALEPEAILFDEPTSALDPQLVGEVLTVMKKIANEGVAMVVVTHEMGFAAKVADRVVFMSEGKIVEMGSPLNIFKEPRSTELRTFLSSWVERNSL
ncbi:MAG: amino acid ABC transporter ATP-binding protein [Castellaniella sp.]